MNKDNLREIVYLVVAIILAILAVKLMIWLLPIVLIVLLACYIYGEIKKDRNINQKTNKSKKTVIIDEVDNEK